MSVRHAPSCDRGVDSTARCTCDADAINRLTRERGLDPAAMERDRIRDMLREARTMPPEAGMLLALCALTNAALLLGEQLDHALIPVGMPMQQGPRG